MRRHKINKINNLKISEPAMGVRPAALSEETRHALLRLGEDLPALWHHPMSSPQVKKRIVRTLLHEIVVNVQAIVPSAEADRSAHGRGGLPVSTHSVQWIARLIKLTKNPF
jgi:hypothetical protein